MGPGLIAVGSVTVTKFLTAENGLEPPEFFARTRQKYSVVLANGPICRDVPVMMESSTTTVPNSESTDNCTLYDVAPVDASHCSVNVVGCPVAPDTGETSLGAGGEAAIVVKFHVVEYALVPPAFLARTRQ